MRMLAHRTRPGTVTRAYLKKRGCGDGFRPRAVGCLRADLDCVLDLAATAALRAERILGDVLDHHQHRLARRDPATFDEMHPRLAIRPGEGEVPEGAAVILSGERLPVR